MKDIVLPESAFPHDKRHVVLGRVFTDGRLRASDEDCAKMSSQMVNFYGCTVKDVEEPKVEGQESDPEGDASLVVDNTKQPLDT